MMNSSHNQKDDTLAKRVFGRIAGEHLTPRPRWEFLLTNYGLWAFGALAVLFGAFAFSATLFEIQNVDWRLSPATHTDFPSFFLSTAPIVWVTALALFLLVGYINVRRTTHGYRYSFTVIALGAVLVSLAIGSGLYLMGLGGSIDESIGDHPPFYRPVLTEQRSLWVTPEKGLLAGQVVAVAPSVTSFTLRDFNGRDWKVDSDDLPNRDITLVARGETVRIVGLPTSQAGAPGTATSSNFHACFVFPWKTRGTFQKGPPPIPLAVLATMSERLPKERSNECKNIRSYGQLHAVENEF